MKVTESIFKSFFEKKKLWNQKPNEFLSCQGRPDLGSLDKRSACLGSGDAGDFEVGGSSGKEREWSSWHAGFFKKITTNSNFLHIALLQGQFNQWGNVWSTADTKKDSERKVTTNEGCVLSEAMSSDTLALEMSEFAEDSLKVIGFSFSNQTWSWGNLPCPKGCFKKRLHICVFMIRYIFAVLAWILAYLADLSEIRVSKLSAMIRTKGWWRRAFFSSNEGLHSFSQGWLN